MAEKPENPPAFPTSIAVSAVGDVYDGSSGMSLRDWFAGHVLAGIFSDVETIKAMKAEAKVRSVRTNVVIAQAAYEASDAMLAERDRTQ